MASTVLGFSVTPHCSNKSGWLMICRQGRGGLASSFGRAASRGRPLGDVMADFVGSSLACLVQLGFQRG